MALERGIDLKKFQKIWYNKEIIFFFMTILVPDPGMDRLSEGKKRQYTGLVESQKFGRLQRALRETRADLQTIDSRIQDDTFSGIEVKSISRENGLRALFQRAQGGEYIETPDNARESLLAVVNTFRRLLLSREDYIADLLHSVKMSLFWPNGMENTIRQGGSGDCYFLAALDALKGNPKGPRYITDNIFFDETNNLWIVQFSGDPQARKMPITIADIQEMQRAGRGIQKGALGDQILERAYARLGNKRKYNRHDGQRDNDTVRVGNEHMAFEGGWPDAVFADLIGGSHCVTTQIDPSDAMPSGVHTVLACSSFSPYILDRRKDIAMSRSHRSRLKSWITAPDDHSYFDEYVEYTVTNFDGQPCKIVGSHAYAIKEVNKERQYVVLANPHDTAQNKRITLSFMEFADKFERLYQAILI